MAKFDRNSDGPMPYGPSSRTPPSEEPAKDATPWGARPADGAPPTPTAGPSTPDLAPPPISPDLAPPPPPSITGMPLGIPVPPPVAQWAPPPGAYSSSVPGAPGLAYGRTLDRVIAFWLDSIIVGIPAFIVTAVLVDGGGSGSLNIPVGPAILAGVISAGIHLIYFVAFWTGTGRATPAMRLMKLQMGDATTGGVPTVQQGLLRWLGLGGVFRLLGILPAASALASGLEGLWILLLLITTALSPTKQGLHDRMAGTALVQPTNAPTPAKACLFIVLALLLIWVVGIVALIFLGGQVSRILSNVGGSI
jgi:uncharacterized RDD family membrane protein YckC